MNTSAIVPGFADPERINKLRDLFNNSPYYRHVKMELKEFTENGCSMIMDVGPDHLNVYEIAHGGSIASLADSTCGLSLVPSLAEGEFAVTQSCFVNYFRPAQMGRLSSKGWVVYRGKTSAVMEADIFNESGDLVAHAQTTHAIRKDEK